MENFTLRRRGCSCLRIASCAMALFILLLQMWMCLRWWRHREDSRYCQKRPHGSGYTLTIDGAAFEGIACRYIADSQDSRTSTLRLLILRRMHYGSGYGRWIYSSLRITKWVGNRCRDERRGSLSAMQPTFL